MGESDAWVGFLVGDEGLVVVDGFEKVVDALSHVYKDEGGF